MKKAMVLLVGLLLSELVSAGDKFTTCGHLHEIASLTMDLRQQEIPKERAFAALDALSPGETDLKVVMGVLIDRAYQKPLEHGKAEQEMAALEFADQWFWKCYRSYK